MASLRRRASRWGVALSYDDYRGEQTDVSNDVVERALDLMGATDDGPPIPATRVVRWGSRARLGKGVVETEDGRSISSIGQLPREVPIGYHTFVSGGSSHPLIVAPGRCHLPPGLREWGWATQVYSLHSKSSWGIGDLGDLARLGEWATSTGAGALMINPLHAATPSDSPQPSPYSPGSRLFKDPLYIDVEALAAGSGHRLGRIRSVGRRLTGLRLVDRAEVRRVKLHALESIWRARGGDAGLSSFRKERGRALTDFATYCAIAELHGSDWHAWPRDLRNPRGRAVARVRAANRARVDFYAWLQFVVESQSESASRSIPMIGDLAVGVDPNGPDAWMFQEVFAHDARIGAPPDEFNLNGQDWGLLAFDPHKLAAAGYRPFIETVRANLRHVAGLRLDHVMGLSRLYWVIGDGGRNGTYIKYPARELFDIVCLESVRANAVVVGEDLGTVEPRVRAEMTRRKMLSYRILWFEDGPPSEYPELALAAISNHDLPTVAGVWTRRDVAIQRRLGLEVNADGEEQVRKRARRLARVRGDAAARVVTERLYAALGTAPSALTLGTLEDACGVVERPNYPGTSAPSNWSQRLPLSLEQIPRSRRVSALVDALAEGRARR